jgi:hypothetical protein
VSAAVEAVGVRKRYGSVWELKDCYFEPSGGTRGRIGRAQWGGEVNPAVRERQRPSSGISTPQISRPHQGTTRAPCDGSSSTIRNGRCRTVFQREEPASHHFDTKPALQVPSLARRSYRSCGWNSRVMGRTPSVVSQAFARQESPNASS